jgi:hypothetical protein
LHHATLNTDFFADNKVTVRFDPLPAEARAQKLDFGIRNISTLSVAHNLQHSRRLENPRPLPEIDMYKQISWKQRQDELHPLPVLPDPDSFIDREK